MKGTNKEYYWPMNIFLRFVYFVFMQHLTDN